MKIYFTHDIDWLNPLHPYSVLKTLNPLRRWLGLIQLLTSDIFLIQVEKLILLEKEENIKSIFFIGATQYSLGRHDIRYTVKEKQFAPLLHILKENEIGLHSVSTEFIALQLERLKGITGRNIIYHRAHNLSRSWIHEESVLANNGIKIDFSLGNARVPVLQEPYVKSTKIKQIPTILSDNAFFFAHQKKVMFELEKNLDTATSKNTDVAILFHPENILLNERLWEFYSRIIALIKNKILITENI